MDWKYEWIWSVLANGFPTNNLLGARQEIIMVISLKKQTNKYKEKVVILQSIEIIVILEGQKNCKFQQVE